MQPKRQPNGRASRAPHVVLVGALLACLALAGLVGCEEQPVDRDPEAVVAEFIDRMRRVHGDPEAGRRAYDLLWTDAKRNLAERAKRASALTGRKVGPEEMIAPSYFALRFRPKHYASRQEGDWAVVTVTGETPSTDSHAIKCVREDGEWRVALEMPPLPPIQQRPDGGE